MIFSMSVGRTSNPNPIAKQAAASLMASLVERDLTYFKSMVTLGERNITIDSQQLVVCLALPWPIALIPVQIFRDQWRCFVFVFQCSQATSQGFVAESKEEP